MRFAKMPKKPGASFNYDTEVDGICALDRYTIQFKLKETRPRFIFYSRTPGTGAVAREVVEMYGDKIMEHPVGTGPFKLDQWTRSSKMTFVRNPNYREEYYEAEPPADDAHAQALYQQMKGKRLPMMDRVEDLNHRRKPATLAVVLGKRSRFPDVPAGGLCLPGYPKQPCGPELG
ncbi:MAG: hypothetical protein IPO43_22795 [Rhodoferax sp.]|nr:hypothetical protein [Rhodoferax sp.]